MIVESPASTVWCTSQATQASALYRIGQPLAPKSKPTPVSLPGCVIADLPSLPASSRSPERRTLTVNLPLLRIIGNDLDAFSTETVSSGGSKDTWVSQLAVNIFTSPSLAHETA